MSEKYEHLYETFERIQAEVGKVIIGQEAVVRQCMIAVFTGNHALIEGIPGIAKTLLVRTLAKVLGCDFGRIQFTPDLMPTDITGTNIYNLQDHSFKLVKGPIFTAFLLADEINRAPAKTQSALLQAMQERQVTIDNQTLALPSCFTVFATQNPIEFEGTYPLPEAQKDRFMMQINMHCPDEASEVELARRTLSNCTPEEVLDGDTVQPVMALDQVSTIRNELQEITLHDDLLNYAVKLVRSTRNHDSILVGAGPRATQSVLLAARANAVFSQRDYVTPDDIKGVAESVLGHRLTLRPEYEIEGLSTTELISHLLETVTVPR